jgi:hypothetical protein
MGTPGEYALCNYGHIIGVIEDDLYWGDPKDESFVYKEVEKLENSQCTECGRIAKYRLCHYGNIDDCLDNNSKLEWNLKENRYIIPDNGIVKLNLNVNIISLSIFNDEIVESLIERFKQSGLKIVHKSQIGKVKSPQVSDEYLHNLMMNR